MNSTVRAWLAATSLLTLGALAATPAAAPARAGSDGASGQHGSGGGRVEQADGTTRRPSVVRSAAPALALAAARDNRLAPAAARTGTTASTQAAAGHGLRRSMYVSEVAR